MPDGRRTRAARLARYHKTSIALSDHRPAALSPCLPAVRQPAEYTVPPPRSPCAMVFVEWCRFRTSRAARNEGGYLGVQASVLWATYTSTMTDEGRSAATRVAARVSLEAAAAGHGLDSRPSSTSSQDNAECRNATVEFVSLSRLPGRR